MSRRPAIITQALIRRMIRAAKLEGASAVELCIGEAVTIIRLTPEDEIEVVKVEDIRL